METLSDNDLYPECNIKEDILHAFIFCERVKAFWEWLENIMKKKKEKRKRKKNLKQNMLLSIL